MLIPQPGPQGKRVSFHSRSEHEYFMLCIQVLMESMCSFNFAMPSKSSDVAKVSNESLRDDAEEAKCVCFHFDDEFEF